MTTRQAYTKMIMTRNISTKLGLSQQTVLNERQRVKAGIYPSIDTMIERLNKAGYSIIQEMEWKIPGDRGG